MDINDSSRFIVIQLKQTHISSFLITVFSHMNRLKKFFSPELSGLRKKLNMDTLHYNMKRCTNTDTCTGSDTSDFFNALTTKLLLMSYYKSELGIISA